jgi:hypothetical protein
VFHDINLVSMLATSEASFTCSAAGALAWVPCWATRAPRIRNRAPPAFVPDVYSAYNSIAVKTRPMGVSLVARNLEVVVEPEYIESTALTLVWLRACLVPMV